MAWIVFSRPADGNLETANARNANPAATKLLIRLRGKIIGLHDVEQLAHEAVGHGANPP